MAFTWAETTIPPPEPSAAMQQHPAYAATCRRWGRNVSTLSLGHRSAPIAHVMVLHRYWPGLGRCALISRGPVWHEETCDRKAALADLIVHLRRNHAAVIVTPETPQQAQSPAGLLELMSPTCVAELDLTVPETVRRARARGKWRNRLVRAEASGITVSEAPLPLDRFHWLLAAEAKQARLRRYRRLPPAFAIAWASANPGKARVFTATKGGSMLAAALVLLHRPAASYHIAWTAPEGRSVSAPALVLWHAANWLAARGFTRFDLDSVDTEDGAGRARFKLGCGADVRMLGATVLSAPGTSLVARFQQRSVSSPTC